MLIMHLFTTLSTIVVTFSVSRVLIFPKNPIIPSYVNLEKIVMELAITQRSFKGSDKLLPLILLHLAVTIQIILPADYFYTLRATSNMVYRFCPAFCFARHRNADILCLPELLAIDHYILSVMYICRLFLLTVPTCYN